MQQVVSLEDAVDRIEEFYRRCIARLGDCVSPAIDENGVKWLWQQAEAWPYGEPNLFRVLADITGTTMLGTNVLIPDKPTLLAECFRFGAGCIEQSLG